MNARSNIAIAAAASLLLASAPALAQGRGKGPPPGHGHAGPHVSGGQGSSGTSSGGQGTTGAAQTGVDRDPGPTGSAEFPVRNFGAWVDDAYILDPGECWLGVGLSYSRLAYANQLDVPVMDASLGVGHHLQVAATIPVSRLRYPDGFSDRYVGDGYLSAKIGLRGADTGVGVAVAPVIEVLSDGSALDAKGQPIGRVHWALPVDVEYAGRGWRTYGSVGYFSRGAVFGSASLDVPVGSSAGALGVLSVTRSTGDPLVFETGTATRRTRADVSAGAYARIGSAASVYGLIGRTISQLDPYSTSLSLSVGISIRAAGARAAAGAPPAQGR